MLLPDSLKKLLNPWFTIPFILWVVAGGGMLLVFTRQQLFYTVNTNYTDWADIVFFLCHMAWTSRSDHTCFIIADPYPGTS